MPRQIDLSSYLATVTNNPTNNIGPGALGSILNQGLPNFAGLLEEVLEEFADAVLGALQTATGLDFTIFIPLVNQVIENLFTIFGDLDPLNFQPINAIITLFNLINSLQGELPKLIVDFVIYSLIGNPGAMQTFEDIAALLGNPTGLGFGDVVLGSLESIPILGPIFTFVQELLDAIANAFGNTGVGHTISEIGSYLTAIPGDVISGITPVGQNIVDAIANALGQSGTGHSVSSLTTYLESIPGSVISGITTIDQNILDGIANAMGQSGTGHTISQVTTYLENIPASVISGITAIEQAILDAIANALGFLGTGHSVANIQSYLAEIPGANIAGSIAASLISGTTTVEQNLIDTVTGIFNNTAGTGNSLTALASNAQSSLLGLIPSILDNGDGTGTLLSGITDNGDGTAFLSSAANSIYSLIDNGDGTATSIANTLQNAAFGALGATGTNIANAIYVAQSTVDSIFNFLTGSTGVGVPVTQAQAALSNQASTTAANTTQITSINTRLASGAGGSGGVNTVVSFAPLANASTLSGQGFVQDTGSQFTSNPNYLVAGSLVSQIGISSGSCVWGSSTTTGYDFQVASTSTNTDYQVVSAVYNSLNSLSTNLNATNAVIGRCNGGTTFVYASIMKGYCVLGCSVAATNTVFNTVAHTPVANALYELVLGNSTTSDLYSIEFFCNGSLVASYEDSSHISQVGSSYRQCGLTMEVLSSGYLPAALSSWSYADNAPPATVGSSFRQYRASTSGVTSATGTNLFPNSFFDTSHYITSDLTYAAGTNNQLTVSIAGTYIVNICALQTVSSGQGFQVVLYHNGSVAQRGNTIFPAAAYSNAWGHTFIVYCAAGDTLQPGYNASNANTLTGESTGTYCYWEVCLANCGTLS